MFHIFWLDGGGIIPAYAGSTHLQTWKGWSGNGSSPHTRGAQMRDSSQIRHDWIIPAYAGSTSPTTDVTIMNRDHPRIRGEHLRRKARTRRQEGSSPHTRGAPVHAGERLGERRIIPAYAGSTDQMVVAELEPLDHPRIRGEHRLASEMQVTRPGSSPHTRGALAGGLPTP